MINNKKHQNHYAHWKQPLEASIKKHIMIKLYRSFAIICLNLIIALTILLITIWSVLEIRHQIHGRGHVIISDAIKFDSFSATSLEVAKYTAKEFDTYASSQPFVFNPWTTFMLAPFSGEHLNIVKGTLFNHRITINNNKKQNSYPEITIWCFGGSTLYGFGVPDSQTIPSHIQNMLNEESKFYNLNIVNFGQPYWFSSVEVAAYNAMLQSDNQPDIVIFFDVNLVPIVFKILVIPVFFENPSL